MKTTTRSVAIGAFAVSLMAAAVAGTVDPRVAKYDTCGRFELFHVNGIMTEEDGGNLQSWIASELCTATRTKNTSSSTSWLITKTQGLAKDFIECAEQVIRAYAGATWDKFMNAVTFGVYSLGMSSTTST